MQNLFFFWVPHPKHNLFICWVCCWIFRMTWSYFSLFFFSLSLIPWRMAFFFTKKNIIMALFFIPSLPITTVTRPPTRPDPLYNHLHYHHYYYYNSTTTTTTTTTTTSSTSPITNKPFYHTPFSMSEHKQISGVLQKPKSNGRRRKVRNKPQTTQTQ